MKCLILGQGVSKRLGPVVNIITKFNVFRPSAYCLKLGYGWLYDNKPLLIGYCHTSANIAWGQSVSREVGLQLLFSDLLKLESTLDRELPRFHKWPYLVRAAVISRAFHTGDKFLSTKMGVEMGGGVWGTLNGAYRPSICFEECLSSEWQHLNEQERQLRIAELDLIYLNGILANLREKEKLDAQRRLQRHALYTKRIASRRPRRRLPLLAPAGGVQP
jgi:hypothetical protein